MPDPDNQNKDDEAEEISKEEEPTLLVRLDEADAVIHLLSMVSCKFVYTAVSPGGVFINGF